MIEFSTGHFSCVKTGAEKACKKNALVSLTPAGAGGILFSHTTLSSFGERAQGRSERGGPCFFPGGCV